jgi:site-specific DNA recombinase
MNIDTFTDMSRYFIYCRKSTEAEDRQVLSIESQINELKRLANQRGLSIAAVLTEARSAKAPGRPVFNEMMQRIYRGEAQGVICWKLDRLARNPIDGGTVIWAVKQHSLEIITPTQAFRQADDNIILMYMEFGMAQKYIDDLSRNVKRGLQCKAETGWYPSITPQGYLNRRDNDKSENNVAEDPQRFELIKRMWDLMLTGLYTPPKILKIANEAWGFRTRQTKKMGGKPLSRSGIYQIFTNPFYHGQFEYPKGSGKRYPGKHKAMITEEEFNQVQALLGRRGNPRAMKHTFPFTGLLRCGECGSMVTAEEKHQLICAECRHKFAYRNKDRCPRCEARITGMKNPKFLHYIYYHCTKSQNPKCRQRAIEVKEMERQIEAYLSLIQISPKFKDWALRYLREIYDQETATTKIVVESRQRAYNDCVKRLENLVSLKTSPANIDGSLLSDVEYGQQRSQLLQDKTKLEQALVGGHDTEQSVQFTEKTFEFARHAGVWFKKGDSKVKKGILSALGSNLVLKDKKLLIEARIPFLLIEKSLAGITRRRSTFEPTKIGSIKAQSDTFGVGLRSKLGGKDDVRTYDNKIIDYGKIKAAKDIVRKIYLWVIQNDSESDKLRIMLTKFFKSPPDYQDEAA